MPTSNKTALFAVLALLAGIWIEARDPIALADGLGSFDGAGQFSQGPGVGGARPTYQCAYVSSLCGGESASGGTNGTIFNSLGVLVAASAPRVGYVFNGTSWVPGGLEVEETKTNLVEYSQSATNWVPINATFATGTSPAPDGSKFILLTNTASGSMTSGNPAVNGVVITGVSTGVNYTISAYILAGTAPYFGLQLSDQNSNEISAIFSATTGVFQASVNAVGGTSYISSTVAALGGGVFRVSATFTSSAWFSNTFYPAVWAISSTAGAATNGQTVNVWGVQVEQSAFPTSYIPTTSAHVTRTYDNIQAQGSLQSCLAGARGTVVAESGSTLNQANYPRIIGDGGGNAYMAVSADNVSALEYNNSASTAVGATYGGSINTQTAFAFRTAMAWAPGNVSLVGNGGTVSTGASSVAYTLPFVIGGLTGGYNMYDGFIRRLACYANKNLPASALKATTVLGSAM